MTPNKVFEIQFSVVDTCISFIYNKEKHHRTASYMGEGNPVPSAGNRQTVMRTQMDEKLLRKVTTYYFTNIFRYCH